jgi:hypothetical protein
MLTIPGLTISEFRRHPIRQILKQAGYGGKRGLPSGAELDALKLPESVRSRVLEDCREVAAIKDEGRHSDAWAYADTLAAQLIESLPDSMLTPDNFARRIKPPDTTTNMSPAELADLVRGKGGIK